MKNSTDIRLHRPDSIHLQPNLPISKSIASRVMMIERILGNKSLDFNDSNICDDITVLKNGLLSSEHVIDANESGTALRFLTAYYSISNGKYVITGSERLKHRPVAQLVEALRQIGANIEYLGETGFCPLKITGKTLSGNQVTIDGSISSQFISALLLIAPTLKNGLTIHITNKIVSKPYINLTIGVMHDFGANVSWKGTNTIEVLPKPYVHVSDYKIEKDWTAASYWFAMKALAEHKGIPCVAETDSWGLCEKSLQGDAIVPSLIDKCLSTDFFEFDFTNNIDLAPTMAVLCHGLDKPFHFTGIETLRIKESDRLTILHEPGSHGDCRFPTFNDHRLAMAYSMLALVYPEIIIEDMSSVDKSYPNYWEDLYKSGIK